jgi:acyl-CoA thioester hydrolase
MKYFSHRHRVCFYETDAMGVVHHSNYFRYFEEARGGWVRHHKLDTLIWGADPIGFAVIEAEAKYIRAALHNDELEIRLQVRREKSRYHFRYALYRVSDSTLLATGGTTHVPVNSQMKICKVPEIFNQVVEKEPWTETWP